MHMGCTVYIMKYNQHYKIDSKNIFTLNETDPIAQPNNGQIALVINCNYTNAIRVYLYCRLVS